jgi:hypothetical protein
MYCRYYRPTHYRHISSAGPSLPNLYSAANLPCIQWRISPFVAHIKLTYDSNGNSLQCQCKDVERKIQVSATAKIRGRKIQRNATADIWRRKISMSATNSIWRREGSTQCYSQDQGRKIQRSATAEIKMRKIQLSATATDVKNKNYIRWCGGWSFNSMAQHLMAQHLMARLSSQLSARAVLMRMIIKLVGTTTQAEDGKQPHDYDDNHIIRTQRMWNSWVSGLVMSMWIQDNGEWTLSRIYPPPKHPLEIHLNISPTLTIWLGVCPWAGTKMV